MFPKYIGFLKITLLAMLFLLPVAYAEDYSNTVNSVQVKQSGKDGVVVDVYVNSKDKNVKPEISTRKHGDKQYVIDLMKVTKGGSVNKDASESSGMVENKGVHVGNTSGGSARVVLDLNNPNVKVKDVRYHFIDEKTPAPNKPANVQDKASQTQKNTPVKQQTQKMQQVKKLESIPKLSAKPTIKAVTPNTKPTVKKVVAIAPKKVDSTPKKSDTANKISSGNVIEHKTTNKTQVLFSKNQSNPNKAIIPTKKNLDLDDKTISAAPVSTNIEHKGTSSQVKHLFHKEQAVSAPVVKKEKPIVEQKPNNIQSVSLKPHQTEVSKPNQEHISVLPKHESPKPETKVEAPIKPHIEDNKQMLAQSKEEQPKPVSHEETKPQNPKAEPKKQVTNVEETPVNFGTEGTEDGNIRTVNTDNAGVDPMGMLFTLVGALVVIIPLIFFVAWLINLFYKGGSTLSLGSFGALEGAKFKIIASTSLGQGRSIHLVEIRGRQLVIGCTNTSINVLSEFTEFDEFVENGETEGIKEIPQKQTTKFKKSRPPVGTFTELYKNYQGKIDQQDLEDEY